MSWFLIVYDRSPSRSLSCVRYPPAAHDAAWDQRTALTLRHLREPNVEVVLIGAASEAVVRLTHARYFQAPAPVVRDAMPAA